MTEFNIGDIDPMFFFWTFISYLIILFHSWKIEKISKDIRGIEVLFLSGALGYFYLLLTKYLISPLIKFMLLWQQYIYFAFQNLPLFVIHSASKPEIQSFIEYLFFGISYSTLLYTAFMIITVIILKSIRYFLDPNGDIFRDVNRFNIYDKYKIGTLLILGIPSILISIAIIILSGGVIFYSFSIIKNASFSLWPIIDTSQWLGASIGAVIMIYFSIILIYVYYKDLWEPIILDVISIIKIHYKEFSEKRDLETKKYSKWFAWFEKHSLALILFQVLWLTLMSLNQIKEGKMSLINFGLIFLPFIIILIIPKKWLGQINSKMKNILRI